MRISVDQKDSGFCALLPVAGMIISLDGSEIRDVITADEEAGEIVRGARNAAGELYIIGDEVAKETLRGTVVVHTPEGFPRDRRKWTLALHVR
jgi:hypothetical protein